MKRNVGVPGHRPSALGRRGAAKVLVGVVAALVLLRTTEREAWSVGTGTLDTTHIYRYVGRTSSTNRGGDDPDLTWAFLDKGALSLPPYLSRDVLSRTIAKHGGAADVVWKPTSKIERKHNGFGACF